jgi:electron transport complex protein RnfD
MSDEPSKELVVKPSPNITGKMSKNRIMQYTFIALLIIMVVSVILWWPVMSPTSGQITLFKLSGVWQMSQGLLVLINAAIAVGIAVGVDALLYALVSDSKLNTWSAAVFGLILTLSYTLGVPAMAQANNPMPESFLTAPMCFVYIALMSLVGLVIFKKLVGLTGRKFVNPAAAAQFIVLLPFISTILLVKDHAASLTAGGLGVPSLAGPIGLGSAPKFAPIAHNGVASFGYYLIACFANPAKAAPALSMNNLLSIMVLDKFHAWTGGASSLAVILVGIGFYMVARRYIKWKIPLAYFISIVVLSLILSTVYGDQGVQVRLVFELFIGSSIFLAFFMATDPGTTPLTGTGQIIFGVGLAILTVVIQASMNFFGGSLLALLIMNLTVPLLDRVGIHKPFGRR